MDSNIGMLHQTMSKPHHPCFPRSQLMSMGTRRAPPRKIIVNMYVNDDVQLKKSENAWKPGMKRESLPEDPETQQTQAGSKATHSDEQDSNPFPAYGCFFFRSAVGTLQEGTKHPEQADAAKVQPAHEAGHRSDHRHRGEAQRGHRLGF